MTMLDLEKTVKLFGMLGSDHDGEVLNSARLLGQYLTNVGSSFYTVLDDANRIQCNKITELDTEIEDLEITCEKLSTALENHQQMLEEFKAKLVERELAYSTLMKSHTKILEFVSGVEQQLTETKVALDPSTDTSLLDKSKKKLVTNEEFVRLAQILVGNEEGKRGRCADASQKQSGWKILISELLNESKAGVYLWANGTQKCPEPVLEKLRALVKERFKSDTD